MASLLLTKADLQAELGLYLGWGRGAANGDEAWDSQQTALLKSFVDSGYARFLNTPPIQGFHAGGHDWSFLTPVMTMLAPAGSDRVELPDDFGGFHSDLTVRSSTGDPRVIKLGHELSMRLERQKTPNTTGRPYLALVSPLKDKPGRFSLELFPTTDQDYTLEGRYQLIPDALTDAWPVAYGGPTHRETLLESCLAVAEERWDHIPNGPHYQAFTRCLTASIRQDRQLKPQHYGYDADRSDQTANYFRDFPTVKYHGTPLS